MTSNLWLSLLSWPHALIKVKLPSVAVYSKLQRKQYGGENTDKLNNAMNIFMEMNYCFNGRFNTHLKGISDW